MAPIVAQDHRNFTEATDAEVIHEIATDKPLESSLKHAVMTKKRAMTAMTSHRIKDMN